jgi:hypothetical protein
MGQLNVVTFFIQAHKLRAAANAFERHGLEAALCAVARSEAAIIKIEAMQASARHLAEFETRLAKGYASSLGA